MVTVTVSKHVCGPPLVALRIMRSDVYNPSFYRKLKEAVWQDIVSCWLSGPESIGTGSLTDSMGKITVHAEDQRYVLVAFSSTPSQLTTLFLSFCPPSQQS